MTPSAESRAHRIAAELLEAEERAVAVDPPSEVWHDMTLADAYAIQAHGRRARLAAGARLVGRKVGLTSLAMQEMLGVDQPDFGYITDAMLFCSGTVLPSQQFIAPRVEAEIAFRLRAPIGPKATFEDVLAATGEVAPALEIIDSRVVDWRIGISDTIADNASSARVVVGEFVPLGEIDLAAVEATLTISQSDGGETSVTGAGAAVLGHPAHAVAWLAAALDSYAGETIDAGEIVLPGAMARALPVERGATARAIFSEIGAVEVGFS